MADEVKTLLRKLNRVLETRNNIIMRGHESFQQSGNPPLDLVKEANKKPKAKRKIQKQNARFKKLERQTKSLKNKLEKAEKKVEEKKKTKLKNLSLRGRGGGGSMQMPQEYSKRSLLKKPMS